MPASAIVSYFALTGVAAAAATLAVRLVTTYVVSSIIAKRQMASAANAAGAGSGTQQVGNRVQLPPATDNKIPVVYGSAYMKPILVDAKISTDQKTMWHVMVFSEAMDSDSIGTFSFGDIYWGDKRLIFGDNADPTKVTQWVNSDGTTESQPNGLINVYLYRDGSSNPVNTALTANQVMQDEQISVYQRWNQFKKMTKLVFAIVKVKYDQEKGITGLADVTAVVNNTLNKPGGVMLDYLKNSRYGAGVPSSKINTTALAALDAYSDETILYTPAGGGSIQNSPRYRINGPVDTTKNFLDNLVDMTESCDSWLQWNEAAGQWSVIMNRSYTDLDADGSDIRQITSKDIIGGIDLNPIDLNSTYNKVDVQFPNTKIKDQPGYYTLDVSTFPNVRTSPNEAENVLSLALPYTNNIIQAQYIAARRLLQSREDLVINFTMNFTGIQIDAGDVIGLTHEVYGWGPSYGMPLGKLFRVQQVQESKNEDGTLFSQIVAAEYNDGVYDDNNLQLQDFTPEMNTGITDPNAIGLPTPVTYTDISATANAPSFTLNSVIPNTGSTLAVEYWYGTTSTISENNYNLWTTELPSGAPVWTKGSTSSVRVQGFTSGTYYWSARTVGPRTKSGFSTSTSITWNPNFIYGVIGQDVIVNFTPPIVSINRNGIDLITEFASADIRAYGQIGGELIPYVDALTDSDASFVPGTWRIATDANNNYTSNGVITTTNVSFVLGDITEDGSGGVRIPEIADMPFDPAYITIPVRFKDAAGNVYNSPSATVQLIFKDGVYSGPLTQFDRSVVSVPRYTSDDGTLVPSYADIRPEATAYLSGGVVPYVDALTDSDPDFVNNSWRIATGAFDGYTNIGTITKNGIDFTLSAIEPNGTGGVRLPVLRSMTTATASITLPVRYKDGNGIVYNAQPAIQTLVFTDQGPYVPSLDFNYSGNSTFKRITTGTTVTFDPAFLNIRAVTKGWRPTISWSVTGASTSTITTTVRTNDTIRVYPSTTTNELVLTATGNDGTTSSSKTLSLRVLTDGVRGFTPLAFVPITQDPNTATQAQLSAAWQALTGFAPVNLDGGSFKQTGGTASKSFTYYTSSGLWVAATLEVPGDLIATGTIRGNALAANEIFTNRLASTQNSTTSTFGSNQATGYWLDGVTGSARFGGDVSIGRNLTIEGLVNGGQLINGVVGTSAIAPGAVTPGTLSTGTVGGASFPGSVSTSVTAGYGNWSVNQSGTFGTNTWQPLWYKTIGNYRILVPSANVTANRFPLRITLSGNIVMTSNSYSPFLMLYLNGLQNPGVIPYNHNNGGSDTTYSNTVWSYSLGRSALNQAFSYTISYGGAPGTYWTTADNNYLVAVVGTEVNATNINIQLTNLVYTVEVLA
jgi:hypothetical protein